MAKPYGIAVKDGKIYSTFYRQISDGKNPPPVSEALMNLFITTDDGVIYSIDRNVFNTKQIMEQSNAYSFWGAALTPNQAKLGAPSNSVDLFFIYNIAGNGALSLANTVDTSTITQGYASDSVVSDGTYFYVYSEYQATLYRVTMDGTLAGSISLYGLGWSNDKVHAQRSMVIGGGYLFMSVISTSMPYSYGMVCINLSDFTFNSVIATDARPGCAAIGGSFLYVGLDYTPAIVKVNLNTLSITDTLVTTYNVWNTGMKIAGNFLYVTTDSHITKVGLVGFTEDGNLSISQSYKNLSVDGLYFYAGYTNGSSPYNDILDRFSIAGFTYVDSLSLDGSFVITWSI